MCKNPKQYEEFNQENHFRKYAPYQWLKLTFSPQLTKFSDNNDICY